MRVCGIRVPLDDSQAPRRPDMPRGVRADERTRGSGLAEFGETTWMAALRRWKKPSEAAEQVWHRSRPHPATTDLLTSVAGLRGPAVVPHPAVSRWHGMRTLTLPVAGLTAALLAAVLVGGPAAGSVGPQAPSGPALTQPKEQLRSATDCQPRAELRAARRVVLLVHGTGEKKDETWSWSYEPALRGDGFATCSVQLPDHGLGDFAVAAEYVVAAVRKASRRGPVTRSQSSGTAKAARCRCGRRSSGPTSPTGSPT